MRKIVLCALLLTLAIGDIANGKVRKSTKKKIQRTTIAAQQQQHYDEIDNYDFLYAGASDDLNLDYDVATVNCLLDEAVRHIGARYRSGSKGPNAFDCSGFTSYVYRQMGYTDIGASSRDQYARNIPVSRSEMQRGDLVFFTSPNSGRNVGHVGIVVDVDERTGSFNFIHASVSRGVMVNNSEESYYRSRYVGARRVK